MDIALEKYVWNRMSNIKSPFKMVLTRETRFGLTFGQIMSLLTLFGGMVTVYVNLNLKIATLDGKLNENTIKIEQLEQGRQANVKSIETIRTENRADHIILSEKLDEVLRELR